MTGFDETWYEHHAIGGHPTFIPCHFSVQYSEGARIAGSIAAGYRVRFPAGARGFFYSPWLPDGLWGPSSLLSSGYLGLKWLGHEADHSSPSSDEFENGGAIPPLPLRIRGVVLN
jgi:hypothetical protein